MLVLWCDVAATNVAVLVTDGETQAGPGRGGQGGPEAGSGQSGQEAEQPQEGNARAPQPHWSVGVFVIDLDRMTVLRSVLP